MFCNWVSEQIEQKPLFLNNIWFSEEAHFHLSGHVNKQNMRFWGSENPHEIVEKPLKVEKCTAWCAMSTHGIIGPYFFEEPETGNALTINQERYRHMSSASFGPHCYVVLRTEGVDSGFSRMAQHPTQQNKLWNGLKNDSVGKSFL